MSRRVSVRIRDSVMGIAVEKSRTIVSALILGRIVTAQDVAWLRREVFADGEVTRASAEELFAVAGAGINNSPEWIELFVELITDHVVWQSRPTGVVSDEEAWWMIERADACQSVEALAAMVTTSTGREIGLWLRLTSSPLGRDGVNGRIAQDRGPPACRGNGTGPPEA